MSGQAILRAVYGMRGMGKTTRTVALLKSAKRVVVFDPQGEYPDLGYRAVAWRDISRIVSGNRGFRISYHPRRGAAKEALHHLCEMLLVIQEKKGGLKAPRLMLVVEEMSKSFPDTKLPDSLWGMKEMSEQGRHANIDVIGTTQRPATISTNFRGNAEETYIFGLQWQNDVDKVSAMIGRDQAAVIRALKPHEYLLYRGNRISRGKNRRRR